MNTLILQWILPQDKVNTNFIGNSNMILPPPYFPIPFFLTQNLLSIVKLQNLTNHLSNAKANQNFQNYKHGLVHNPPSFMLPH